MEIAYRQLVLCPDDDTWVPASRPEFVAMLRQEGVVGALIGETARECFLIGDAFLQLFSFMGCAPSIEFQPGDSATIDWQGFVYVQLSPVQTQPRWLADRDMAKPACPHCQRRSRDWLRHFMKEDGLLHCPHCQRSEAVCRWRWFDGGACARLFLSVVNVYPKESLPTDTLLSQLEQATGVAWKYFYMQAPLLTES